MPAYAAAVAASVCTAAAAKAAAAAARSVAAVVVAKWWAAPYAPSARNSLVRFGYLAATHANAVARNIAEINAENRPPSFAGSSRAVTGSTRRAARAAMMTETSCGRVCNQFERSLSLLKCKPALRDIGLMVAPRVVIPMGTKG